MANICSNNVTITGDEKSLKKLRGMINRQDKKLFGKDGICDHLESTSTPGIAYGLETDLPLKGWGAISVFVTSKWGPPEDDFISLSRAFPKLTVEVLYEEPGMSIYGKATFEDGSKVRDETIAEFDYLMENDVDFGDTVYDIQETPYKEFKKTYILSTDYKEDDSAWQRWPHLLEPLIVKRARVKDLPPLINLEYGHDLVVARLAKVK